MSQGRSKEAVQAQNLCQTPGRLLRCWDGHSLGKLSQTQKSLFHMLCNGSWIGSPFDKVKFPKGLYDGPLLIGNAQPIGELNNVAQPDGWEKCFFSFVKFRVANYSEAVYFTQLATRAWKRHFVVIYAI